MTMSSVCYVQSDLVARALASREGKGGGKIKRNVEHDSSIRRLRYIEE